VSDDVNTFEKDIVKGLEVYEIWIWRRLQNVSWDGTRDKWKRINNDGRRKRKLIKMTLSYRRENARRSMSVEILSTAVRVTQIDRMSAA